MKKLLLNFLLFFVLTQSNFAQMSNIELKPLLNAGNHIGRVEGLFTIPEKQQILTVGSEGTIRIVNAITGETVHIYSLQKLGYENCLIFAAALSSNSHTLAIGGHLSKAKNEIWLINLKSWKIQQVLDGHQGGVKALAFSKDGKFLVSGGQLGDIKIWETNTYSSKVLPNKHKADIITLAIGNNAEFIVSADRTGDLILWRIANGQYKHKILEGHSSIPLSIAIATDESYFATADIGKHFVSGGKLIGWNMQGDKLWSSEQFLINHNALGAVSISPNNRYLAFKEDIIGFTNDFKVHILDLNRGQIISSVDYHDNVVLHTIFYDDTTLVSNSGGITKTILADWQTKEIKQQWQCEGLDIKYSAFINNNEELYLGFNKITEKDRKQKGIIFSLKSFEFEPVNLAHNITSKPIFFKDKKLEKINSNNLQITNGNSIQFDDSKEGRIQEYFFTRNGNIIVVGDFMVKYLTNDGQVIRTFQDRAGELRSASVSSDNQYLTISGTDQLTQLYNLQTGELLASFFFNTDNDWVLWSPKGYYASSNPEKSFLSWFAIEKDKLPTTNTNNLALQKKYYQPELLKRILSFGSLEKALKSNLHIPPIIRVEKSPNTISSQNYELAFQVEAPNGIASIEILVNEEKAGFKKDFKGEKNYQSKSLVSLRPDTNRIVIVVKDKNGLETNKVFNLRVAFTPEVLFSSGHKGIITATCFSSDGKYIASASRDNTLKIWSFNTGNLHQVLDFEKSKWTNISGISGVVFHPTDSKKISAFGTQTLFSFDLHTGEMIFNQLDQELSFKMAKITGIAYDATGNYLLVTSSDGFLKYWNTQTGQVDFQLQIHQGAVTALATSNDGKYLITQGADNLLQWIDIQNRTILKKYDLAAKVTLTEMKGYNDFIAVSTNQQLLAVGGEAKDRIEVFDLQKEQKIYELRWEKTSFSRLAFSADNQYLAVGKFDEGIQLLEPSTGKLLKTITQKALIPQTLSFHPNLPILLSGQGVANEFILRSWQVPQGELLMEFGNDVSGINTFALSNNKKFLATSGVDKMLWVWDLQTLALKTKLPVGKHSMELLGTYDLAFNATDSLLAVASCDNVIRILDLTTNHFILEKAFEYPVRSIAFHPLKEELFVAEENIKLWDLSNDKVELFGNHRGSISKIKFNKEGDLLGAIGEEEFSCWDTYQHKKTHSQSFLKGNRGNYSLHGTGRTANHAYIATYGMDMFSKENAFIFSNPLTKTIQKYDAASNSIATIYPKEVPIFGLKSYIALAISPNNEYLAASKLNENVIDIIDLKANTLLNTLQGHKDAIGQLSFDPTGTQLYSCSKDGTVRVWDWKNGKESISLTSAMDGNYVFKTVDNYYYSNQQGQAAINFLVDSKVFPFEQFDVLLNRPDTVLQRFNDTENVHVQYYKKAYEKRLEKMDLKEVNLKLDFSNLPEISIKPTSAKTYTSNPIYTFDLSVDGKTIPITQVDIFVNDVPIYGKNGLNFEEELPLKIRRTISFPLSNGRNKIQVAALNKSGGTALKETFYITYEGTPRKPTLYLITIGVDDYESGNNLNYPEKDARDVANFFQNQKGQFNQIKSYSFLGADFSEQQLRNLKPILDSTQVDDVVILFYAGHGTVDAKDNFYITSKSENISYDTLEVLLDGIPARQKLVFLDACYSGERDIEFIKNLEKENTTIKKIDFSRDADLRNRYEKTSTPFYWMKQLFVDLRRENGETVISAAQGDEQAMEASRWGNGVFTYALLKGLRDGKADFDKDGLIKVSDLKRYVAEIVPLLTNERQQPTSRVENISNDFDVFVQPNQSIELPLDFKSDLELIFAFYAYANPLMVSKDKFQQLLNKHQDKLSVNSALLVKMERIGQRMQQIGSGLTKKEIREIEYIYQKIYSIDAPESQTQKNEPTNLIWVGEEIIWLTQRLPEITVGDWHNFDKKETKIGAMLKKTLDYIATNDNVSLSDIRKHIQAQDLVQMQCEFLHSFIK